jgi:hypothetical protein
MDPAEYKLIKFDYSEEDLKKISEYNSNRVKTALELLVHNRKKLQTDNDYFKLTIQERINKVQTSSEFGSFCNEFPVVSKYIIAYGMFSTKAFKKYTDWKARLRPSDKIRSELSGNQLAQEHFKNKYIYAVYVKFLYADKNPRASIKEVNEVYIDTVNSLDSDSTSFFQMYESAKAEAEQHEHHNKSARIARIKEQLQLAIQKKIEN